MSCKKVNEKSQVTKKMVRITIEVKIEIVENMKVAYVSGTWLIHTVCRERQYLQF